MVNQGIVEREMVYASANISKEQAPILNEYIVRMEKRGIVTGVFIGFIASVIGILISLIAFSLLF